MSEARPFRHQGPPEGRQAQRQAGEASTRNALPRPAGGRNAGLAANPPGGAHAVLPTRVSDDRRLTDSDLRLLLAFSGLLDRFGEISRASAKDLENATGMSRATVFRRLKALETYGWIIREPRWHPYSGAQLANAMRLNFDNPIPAEFDRLALTAAVRPQPFRPQIAGPHDAGRDQPGAEALGASPENTQHPVATTTSPPGLTDETGAVSPGSPDRLSDETGPVSPARPLNMDIISIKTTNPESIPTLAMAMAVEREAPSQQRHDGATDGPGTLPARAKATASDECRQGDAAQPGEPAGEPDKAQPPPTERELAELFAAIRQQFFPHAPRRPPPKAGATMLDWYRAFGASVKLIENVLQTQCGQLVLAKKGFPASPSMFAEDVQRAVDQLARLDRLEASGQGAGQVAGASANPWHALDSRLRRRLSAGFRNTAGLIDLRVQAQKAALGPEDLERLFDQVGAWETTDPVYKVKSHLMSRKS